MDLGRAPSFGTLVTTAPNGEPIATHLPFAFFEERGEYGSFFGHIAATDPQVQRFAPHSTDAPLALITFLGPDSYISPRGYGTDKPVMPTWNYMAVHVYGRPRVIEDASEVHGLMKQMIDRAEAEMPEPWSLDSQDEEFVQQRRDLMVAFEIEVERISTKARLGRKLPAQENEHLTNWLQAQPDSAKRELASFLRASI